MVHQPEVFLREGGCLQNYYDLLFPGGDSEVGWGGVSEEKGVSHFWFRGLNLPLKPSGGVAVVKRSPGGARGGARQRRRRPTRELPPRSLT